MTRNGREYISLAYDTGLIYKTGEQVSLPGYGKVLTEYGLDVSYDLYTTGGTKVDFDRMNFVKTFANSEAGGYNLKMTVSNGSKKTVFDNMFYVSDGEDFYGKYVISDWLRYNGMNNVGGTMKECFSLIMENNVKSHRKLEISSEYINQMLDEGRTEVSITLYTADYGIKDQQIYRVIGGELTYSNGSSMVHGTDYWNYNLYDQFVTVKFQTDESCENKTFGFIVMRDAIIGDISFNVPA